MTTANYQVTFEAINPLYILDQLRRPLSRGPGRALGHACAISVPNCRRAARKRSPSTSADSAAGGYNDAIGTEAQPRPMPASGLWCGRLSQVGQTDWFTFPVRGSRTFTVVTQALDETGAPTERQGHALDRRLGRLRSRRRNAPSAPRPASTAWPPAKAGCAWPPTGDDIVRLGIADQRGDGRPDYAYKGWVLYADTVSPARLPASGGPIVIHGMGFRLADTVLVGGQPALVTSISPNEITAIAPPAATGVTGSVDVEVDDLPIFYAAAVIPGGISYDSGTGDALTLVTAPMTPFPSACRIPFTVTALGSDLTPAGGVTVIYTVTSGTATLGCGLPACTVTATGDGRATMNVTAINSTWSIVTASLTNGSSLQAQFGGGTPPALASLTPQLSLAAGATVTWTVQALVLKNGIPLAGQSVAWQTRRQRHHRPGPAPPLTNSSGIAAKALTVGPLTEGQTATINACLNGTSQCVTYTAFGARPEYALLEPSPAQPEPRRQRKRPARSPSASSTWTATPWPAARSRSIRRSTPGRRPARRTPSATQGALLATQAATATSALDGSVTFLPASLPGVATNLLGLAVTGNTASVNIAIEQHP